MFSGGDYEEVGRWLRNFVISHVKRENPRVEAVVEMSGPFHGRSYGIRLSLAGRTLPAPDRPPLEISFAEVARERGTLAWCQAWADRLQALARELSTAEHGRRKSA
jgi:hypothetical protein